MIKGKGKVLKWNKNEENAKIMKKAENAIKLEKVVKT